MTQTKLLATAALLGVGVGGVLLLKNMVSNGIKDIKHQSEVNKIGTSEGVIVAIAISIHEGFHPLGSAYSWMSAIPDGTNEEKIYKAFRRAYLTQHTFSDVSKVYKRLYDRELAKDFQSELNQTERNNVTKILQGEHIQELENISDAKILRGE